MLNLFDLISYILDKFSIKERKLQYEPDKEFGITNEINNNNNNNNNNNDVWMESQSFEPVQ